MRSPERGLHRGNDRRQRNGIGGPKAKQPTGHVTTKRPRNFVAVGALKVESVGSGFLMLQGKGNVLLFPLATDRQREGPVQCRERLGGLLRYYHREAA
jgi:hypothetical protein